MKNKSEKEIMEIGIIRERRIKLAKFMIGEILNSDVYIPISIEDKLNFILYCISMMGFVMDYDFRQINEVYLLKGGLL